MNDSNWKDELIAELGVAMKARAAGNAGKTRVCARRGAGIVVGEYLRRRGHAIPGSSAIERLKFFRGLPECSSRAGEIADLMVRPVNVDHTLSVDTDLIFEALWLTEELLEEIIDLEEI